MQAFVKAAFSSGRYARGTTTQDRGTVMSQMENGLSRAAHGWTRRPGVGRRRTGRRRTWKPSPKVCWALGIAFILLVVLTGLLADR